MHVTRRIVLAALPLAGCMNAAAARVSTIYIAPDGSGDGSSWSAAASLGDIERLVREVEPGGEILLAADRGPYQAGEGFDIDAGGAAGLPVRIRGVNSATGAPMPAILRGARGGDEAGAEGFRLGRGANHLHFSHLAFQAVGNGCFRVCAPLSHLIIEDCAFDDVYRFLENTRADGQSHASLLDFVVRRCRGARVERGFLRIRYASRRGLIEDCEAQGLANEGGHIPAGCAVDDRAGDITYRRCVMSGFQQWRAGDYWNGDGFSDEENNFGIRYEACVGRGSTDGGFDCKSRDVVLTDCVAEDNKRNFRIWSDRARLTRCISRNPNFRGRDQEATESSHIWIGGEEDARVLISDLTIEDSDATPIIEFEHDVARVDIRGVTINSPHVNWGNDEERIRSSMLHAQQP
jgi:hypothetical protein